MPLRFWRCGLAFSLQKVSQRQSLKVHLGSSVGYLDWPVMNVEKYASQKNRTLYSCQLLCHMLTDFNIFSLTDSAVNC